MKFVDANKQPRRPRASIHKSGKLGFNKDAMDVMSIDTSTYYLVGLDDDNEARGNIYLVECSEREKDRESCVKAAKAGDYFYLGIKNVFERFNFEFDNYKFIYDIEESQYKERKMWILRSRDELKSRN